MKEDEGDERHAGRIDEHQHRDGRDDDRLEAEEADQVRDDREEADPGDVGELAREFKEEGRATGEQTHRRREAGKKHDHGEEHRARVTEKDLRAFSEHRSTRFLHADRGNALRADLCDENVDDREQDAGKDAGLADLRAHGLRILEADFANRADHERGEDERRNGVERVVAVKNALNSGTERILVGTGRRLEVAHRRNEGHDDENGERHEKRGRQELADAVDELRGRRREPEGDSEEDREEDGKRKGRGVSPEEGTDGDFKGDRARTWNGEAGTDRHVADHRIEKSVERVHAARHFAQIVATRIADSDNAEKRKAHARNAEAEKRPVNVCARRLPHGCRENEVAGAEKECKQHRADGDVACAVVVHVSDCPVFSCCD